MLRIEAGFHSDQGDRENNEDRAEILADGRVCVVADGLGGHGGGEVASRLAVETVQRAVAAGLLEELAGEDSTYRGLQRLFSEANRQILTTGQDVRHLRGMGTTMTLALISGERLFFAHVGDSRLYLWQDGQGEQLTEDHTQAREFVDHGWLSPAEAEHSRYRHVLTKCLGVIWTIKPQLGARQLRAGTRLLLCSDGLYNEVEPERLSSMLAADQPPGELAGLLVTAAKGNGRTGLDNMTALVVRLD